MRTHFDPSTTAERKEGCTPVVRAQGEIQVYGPIYRPTRWMLVSKKGEVQELTMSFQVGGVGCFRKEIRQRGIRVRGS